MSQQPGTEKTQAFSVKRAEVEFHRFAALGEPERALNKYTTENVRRRSILNKHLAFAQPLTPFLEIGAAIGHSSLMLCNEFGAEGFALDLSADALRYGSVLQEMWQWPHTPVRLAGDATKLPFADNSLRFVMACQMLSQFMDIESVFLEVKRVLAPGGVFFFTEEPMRRLLSLRLYRTPYFETMKPWERWLSEQGLLGYLVQDVIGAQQEESFGIRQNHTMGLAHWHTLIQKHFVAQEYELFVPERGWGERLMKQAAVQLDPHRSIWRAARLLGGTLSAFCCKAGTPQTEFAPVSSRFEQYFRCPDCQRSGLERQGELAICCPQCGYQAASEDGVYNLLPSADRKELYPGSRADIIDFGLPTHAQQLGQGFYEVEGVYGNQYRWIGERATAQLTRVLSGPQRLRIRGHASELQFRAGTPPRIEVNVNSERAGAWPLERTGLFVVEADLPDAAHYDIEIVCRPTWQALPDERMLSVNLSMIRLVPQEQT